MVLRDRAVVGLANHVLLIDREGRRLPIDDSAAPILDEAGQLLGVVMVFRDATAQRDNEDTRRHLAAIIQSSDDAIVTKTLSGIITSWNPAAERIFGYMAPEVLGRPITLLFPADRLSEESEFLRRLARGQHVDHFQTVRIRKGRAPGSRVRHPVAHQEPGGHGRRHFQDRA
jgi:PAS domain S-box-containing protein